MGSEKASGGFLETSSPSKNLLKAERNLLRKQMLSHPLWLTPSNSPQIIPREFAGVTEVKCITPILSEYFGVIGGVLLPKRDNTRRCNFSWELRLLNPQKLFGVIGGVIIALITVDTEIQVKLIPRKYVFAFAFVFIFLLY